MPNEKQFKVQNGLRVVEEAYFESAASISGALNVNTIVFEGATANDFETTLTVTDPTADRTITFPDANGTVVTTGNINDAYPSQSGQNGKYLKTDGSNVSWDTVAGGSQATLTIGTGLSGTSYNGSSPVTIAVDSSVVTTSGTQTLTNKTLTTPLLNQPIFISAQERVNIVASAATDTINIDALTASIWYYTSNASANHTLNFRGNSGSTLNSILSTGDSMTLAWLNTNGATPFFPNVVQIDGSNVTPRWQGGTAPSAGNASSIDVYTFTIIKTSSATFIVLADVARFA